ncbi:MAG: hypothetical protein ACTH2Q_14125 [Propionibacteriaceae bacterium]
MPTTKDTSPHEDLAALMAILDRLAATEFWRLSKDEQLGRMDGYGVAIDRLHGIRRHTVRAVDEGRVCEDTASWSASDRITLTDRTTPRSAKKYVRTANQLVDGIRGATLTNSGEDISPKAVRCSHYLPDGEGSSG